MKKPLKVYAETAARYHDIADELWKQPDLQGDAFTAFIASSPLLVGIETRLMQGTPTGPPPPMTGVTGAVAQPQPGRPAQPSPADFQSFVQYVTPSMISYLEEADGAVFADWMAAGHPEWLPRIQTLTHASMPGQQGAPVITAFYKQSQWWPQILKTAENDPAKFDKFVAEFCAWKPEAEHEPAPAATDDSETEKTERVEV